MNGYDTGVPSLFGKDPAILVGAYNSGIPGFPVDCLGGIPGIDHVDI